MLNGGGERCQRASVLAFHIIQASNFMMLFQFPTWCDIFPNVPLDVYKAKVSGGDGGIFVRMAREVAGYTVDHGSIF